MTLKLKMYILSHTVLIQYNTVFCGCLWFRFSVYLTSTCLYLIWKIFTLDRVTHEHEKGYFNLELFQLDYRLKFSLSAL